MKKILLAFMLAFSLVSGNIAHAQGKPITYTALEPLPGLGDGTNINFAQFLGTVFKLLLTAGALLAVGTLVYAGISYMLSGAYETMGEAKNRMKAALWGLVILLGAWLMLYTINPALLNFCLSSVGTTNDCGGGVGTNTTNSPGNGTSGGVVVNGGTGVTIYDSMPVTADQMNEYQKKCSDKGQTFKQIDSGTDDIGHYTEYKCQ